MYVTVDTRIDTVRALMLYFVATCKRPFGPSKHKLIDNSFSLITALLISSS